MTLRLISSFAALPLFFIVIYFLPPICMPIAIAVLSVISVYELLWRSQIARETPLIAVAYLYAVAIPFWVYFGCKDIFVLPGIFVFILAEFILWLVQFEKLTFEKLTAVFFGGIIVPLFFSSTVGILGMEHGKLFILIPFIAAWMTDTGAYFTGIFLGKHKLAPKVSPKKTVEGAIGGIVICVLSFLLYGVLIRMSASIDTVAFLMLALCGTVLSVIAQLGDLSMSLIKREYRIKDYGVAFPGHGGILDRFDSVLFTAPATWILLRMLTIAIS